MQMAGVCIFLILAVLAVFGQTADFEFVNYDDQLYVYQNPVVERGLSVQAVGWAFTHAQVCNWIPLTTLSHMLDCQFFGLHAGGHHLVNVLWHAASAVLLFLLLRQLTGSLWRSAFVAAVFAVHPLRAESVAWISERKDVLSGFFLMLTIGAYIRQVRNPSRAGYVAVVVLFVCGLLAKSMVATLPFVLLLLDYWPLKRLHNARQFASLIREKIPLFALSAGACVAAALMPGLLVRNRLPLFERIGNALVSYVVYLRQMIFPAGLAANYPIAPDSHPIWLICLAFVFLAGISAVLVAWRKKYPYLLVGWLWYLGMLFPVIGIMQISGDAAHADRYTYLPEIGLALAGTWAVAGWSAEGKFRPVILSGLMMALIGTLIGLGHIQTSYWRDSETLWTRALACTSDDRGDDFNSVAHNGLGNALYIKGKREEAIAQYRKALEISPNGSAARSNLGVALYNKGMREEAIAQYRKALEITPDLVETRCNLGDALFQTGHKEEAFTQFRKALELDPYYVRAEYNWGDALALEGKLEDAIAHFRKLVKINPGYPKAYSMLGLVFFEKGDTKEAIDSWRQALKFKPDQPDVQNNLAWLLATAPDASLRQGAKAVALAERANQLNGSTNAAVLHTLAAAYAETGRYGDATATARRALELAVAQKNGDLTIRLPREIKLYETGLPMRDVPQ